MRASVSLAFAASLSLLTACATPSLEELRRTAPSGNPLQSALAKEYLAFAESEARQYDWGSSKHFADKGLKAAYGQDVAPEEIAAWDIEKPFIPELTSAREQLLSVLSPAYAKAHPETVARAQFFFDCWVEQQHEAWQEDDIASCREGFYRSVRVLKGAPVAEEPEETTPLIFSTSYIVFFEWNKSVLTPDAIAVIDTVAEDLKTSEEVDYEVVLNGHADRSGTPEYNLKLSQKRAEAVKNALVERGISTQRIRYYAFGETDNRIPTTDKVKEQANRRVEIFFNQ